MTGITERLQQYEEERSFLRQAVVPEESRRHFTTTPWRGGYRYFESPNVVCLEKVRAVMADGVKPASTPIKPRAA